MAKLEVFLTCRCDLVFKQQNGRIDDCFGHEDNENPKKGLESVRAEDVIGLIEATLESERRVLLGEVLEHRQEAIVHQNADCRIEQQEQHVPFALIIARVENRGE